MSDISDTYKAIKAIRKQDGQANRDDAVLKFDKARFLAEASGMTLVCHTSAHYQLSNGSWLIDVYPGNQRVRADKQKAKAPYLDLPSPWTLLDVVNEAKKGDIEPADLYDDLSIDIGNYSGDG